MECILVDAISVTIPMGRFVLSLAWAKVGFLEIFNWKEGLSERAGNRSFLLPQL
jgi:hypothetical protein